MALTDLIIPRRNVVSLDFIPPTTAISGSGSDAVMYSYSNQTQFPVVSSLTGNVAPDNAGVGTGDEPRFGNLLLNGANEFGIYFPSIIEPGHRSFIGNGYGLLSDDFSEFILTLDQQAVTNEGAPITAPQIVAYRTLPADITTMTLTTSYFPIDGQIECQADTGFVSTAALAPVYTLGTGILAYGLSDSAVYLAELNGTWHKAFETDADYDIGFLNGPVTTNDGTYNYTTVFQTPTSGTNSVYMSKWQPAALGDPFSCTNYKLILDDATDDISFQAAADTGFASLMRIRGNTTNTFYTIDETTDWMSSMTVFMFADDFSYYDRLNITSNGDLFRAVYFRDINGLHYLIGTNSSNIQAYQLLDADGGTIITDEDEPTDDSAIIRVWGYSLDGHDFYVLRLGPSQSLIYDLTTGQWAEWATPNRDNWRAHCGQNWVGMSSATFANGFGSDVVCGDDASGTLWILDPNSGLDDRSTTGSDAFTRMVIGGIPLTGRETISCGAVQLTCSLGNPALTGASITLRTSDDFGNNYTDHGAITVVAGSFDQIVEWRSLGLIRQPGRVFELSDNGAAVRISGLDLR